MVGLLGQLLLVVEFSAGLQVCSVL